MRRIAITARAVWARGFLPALLVLLLGLFSAGASIIWTAPATGISPTSAPFRAHLAEGRLLINWGWPDQRRWIGRLPFYLGVGTNNDGSVSSGWGIERPLWSPKRLHADWALEVHPHHVKLPLLWLWIPAAVPPAAFLIVRRLRRREPYQCPGCRYDRRGVLGPCPECGHPPSKSNGI